MTRPALLVLVRHGQSERNVAKKHNRFYLDDEARKGVSQSKSRAGTSWTSRHQPDGKVLDPLDVRQPTPPLRGYSFHSVVCAGNLSIHRSGGIRIVAEVDCEQRALFERGALRKRPQRRLQRLDDVAGAADVGGLASAIGTSGDVADRLRLGELRRVLWE
jgi:hypothetical protein